MANTTVACHLSITPYTASLEEYLTAHPHLAGLIVSAVIPHADRILIIQRAAHDGFPLKWEIPGGGVDSTDANILQAVHREVFEETGLMVSEVLGVAETLEFDGSNARRWRKITFLVSVGSHGSGEVIPRVNLDAEEHVDWAWVTEREVLAGRAEGKQIDFAYDTQRQLLLDAFSKLRAR
ncbi:hypothetical protein VTJ49DRAFT_1595 [Mycothermus thermophilus]|uniref:Nudix hydrolase domain-containing protein n=1 Tax=Humicola insolens TaxID=85995 RepID=A0ABR3VC25_HUMIN